MKTKHLLTFFILIIGFVGIIQVNAQVWKPNPSSISLNQELTAEEAVAAFGCDQVTRIGSWTDFVSVGTEALAGTSMNDYNCATKDVSGVFSPTAKREFLINRLENSTTRMLAAIPYNLYENNNYSGIYHFANTLDEIIYTPDVAAQFVPTDAYFPGDGQTLLSPIYDFWGWAVVLSYSLLTVIVMIIALALIFRNNLGGEQAVQLQNAIPGIVIAMIAIPLSFGISGLFFDLINIGTNATHFILFNESGPGRTVLEEGKTNFAGNFSDGRQLYPDDPRLGVFNFRGLMGTDVLNDGALSLLFPDECSQDNGSVDPACSNGAITGNILWDIIAGVNPITQLIGAVFNFVITFLSLFVAARIAIILIRQFLTLMLLPILSPFYFLAFAVPRGAAWVTNEFFKRMLNAALIFIAAYGLYLIVVIFMSGQVVTAVNGATPQIQVPNYSPPLLDFFSSSTGNNIIGGANDVANTGAITGGGAANAFLFLIGFALYISIPGILDKITSAIAVRPPTFAKGATDFFSGELSNAANLAFRTAPEAAGGFAGTVASGGLSSINMLRNRALSRQDSPTGKTRKQELTDSLREEWAQAQADGSANLIKKRSIQAKARLNNIDTKDLNLDEESTFKKIEISVSGFSAANSGENGRYTIKSDRVVSNSLKLTGNLVLKVPDDSPIPPGMIHIDVNQTNNSIGKLEYKERGGSGKPTSTEVNIITTAKINADNDLGGNLIDSGVSFGGKREAKIPISIEIPAAAAPGFNRRESSYEGIWEQAKDITVFAGQKSGGGFIGASGKFKGLSVNVVSS